MAKPRIGRWFQFGVLDLMILTANVAIVALLCRPAQAQTTKAAPWIVGVWHVVEWSPTGDDLRVLGILPDGCYYFWTGADVPEWRFRWTMAPLTAAKDAFVLKCDKHRLIIRSEWGSGIIEVLNENSTIRSRLVQYMTCDGALRDGTPDGEWKVAFLLDPEHLPSLLTYRNGEPVDGHEGGRRSLYFCNVVRTARGLAELKDSDFPDQRTLEGKSP